ncbi:MAG TPA: hypothetical protein DD490_18105 [Acidobacteria bacterium]|nr:hypothetical protein [Acidobacteriota bacterium]
MARKLLSLVLATLVLAVLVLTPAAAQAAPLRGEGPLAGVLEQFTAWIIALAGELGCGADPNGGCTGQTTPTPPAEGLDNRCALDPSGACLDQGTPADQIDIGCSLDPSGAACGNHG